ncbi:MAG: hypothetical protein SGJ23_05390 [Alphaproteobacteria bacterium]|nr:hypothetical protein [Alphaproteobacteria bacterium]
MIKSLFGGIHVRLDAATLTDALRPLFKHLEKNLMQKLNELRAEIAANTSATQSVVTLVNTLADRLDAVANDPVEIAAITAELRANNAEIAAAVTENTPAAEPPPQ